jgi:uncharacterized protein
VILVDANILVYAHVGSLPQHERTHLAGHGAQRVVRVGLPWPSLLGFLRLVTNPRVFQRPESMADTWAQVSAWLGAGVAWIPQPTDRHRDVFASLLAAPGMQANLVPDARLAALAIEHGLTLCSTDGDFGRFPALRWRDPLAA